MLRPLFLMNIVIFGLVAAALAPVESHADHARIPIEELQAYNKLDPDSVTVSGISSGAFFAHQFHIAYSSLVKGAGMVDGGLYGCAEQIEAISPPFDNPLFLTVISRRIVAATAVCTHFESNDFQQAGWHFPTAPNAKESQKTAVNAHQAGIIDNPANLKTSRVWIFHGSRDTLVPQSTIKEMKAFYQLMGIPTGNVREMVGPDAKHGMPIKTLPPAGAGRHCKLPDPSFMVRCDYGAAELLLSHLYPDSSAAAPASMVGTRLFGFDQTEFFDEKDKSTSLNEAGYLYVPAACENSSASPVKCRLHVAFHGCEQYVDKIHDIFFRDAGYNAWAEANNVIVLYPQATQWLRSPLVDPTQVSGNPKGCWDWWGYSGAGYYGQNGKQMRAVRAMIDRMLPK